MNCKDNLILNLSRVNKFRKADLPYKKVYRNLLVVLLFFSQMQGLYAQLGFCEGSKGDPIFHEDFGNQSTSGLALSPDITTYQYVTGDPDDGQYTISNSIGQNNSTWHSYFPDTPSGGRALIVNASYTSGQFYRKEITGLCQNTTYEFSAYLLNVYNRASNGCVNGGIPVNVRFEIWDESDSQIIKEGSTESISSTTTPQWKQFAITFRSVAGQQSVILKMFNNGDGGCGNDLAIDDIIFRSCGDLTTIATKGNSEKNLTFCEENLPVSSILKATSDSKVYSQQFYQWQRSTNSEDWSNIPGATLEEYEVNNLTSTSYFRVKVAEDPVNLANNLCSSASEAFKILIIKTPSAPISGGDVLICDNSTFPGLSVSVEIGETVNWYNDPTGGGLLAENTTVYFPETPGTYYAEALNKNYTCAGSVRTAINYTVLPSVALEDQRLALCENGSLTLDAEIANLNYLWSTGATTKTIEILAPGNYFVDVTTPEGCSTRKIFEIFPVVAASIDRIISEGSTIIIVPRFPGDFEASLDGITFQSQLSFPNAPGGIYTAYLRDLNGCNTSAMEFAHLVLPKFISPNNDGYMDYFELRGVTFFGASEIRIYDRFGRLIAAGPGENFRWDGTYKGIPLPEDDYWYEILIEGLAPQRGNFSLIR